MAVQTNTFKGARYVPKFANPIEWSADNSYEAIESVQHEGFTYLSKQPVPAGVQITNTDFWLEWADPNAQMEQLRQEVGGYVDTVEELSGTVENLSTDLSAETTNREAADTAITADVTELQNKQPTINDIADLTNRNNALFPFDENILKADVLQKNYANVIMVNEDLSLESAIAAGLQSTLNVSGNSDFCEAITLYNTYAQHADEFVYNNAYTGTTYEGTFNSPTLVNPNAHLLDGKKRIDCATFTNLIGDGITYDSSSYNLNTSNRALHAMYYPTALTSKAYWKYSPHDDREDEMGFGRILSDGFAKMLFDAGQLTIIDGYSENIQPGDILFSGTASNRFLQITHCNIVIGFVDNTLAGTVLGEAVNGTEIPIRSIPMNNVALNSYRAKVTPNYNGGIKLTHKYLAQQALFMVKNRDFNTYPYEHTNSSILAEVFTCVNNADSAKRISINANNGSYTISKSIIVPGKGIYNMFLPYGWSYTISAPETTDFHFALQKTASDRNIVIPTPDF